jgi:ABC-2 type transport system permease protein
MTTTMATPGTLLTEPNYRPARFTDVLHSEWTKARTVRSTMWTLLITTVLGIGLGALISGLAGNSYDKASLSTRLTWDPTAISGSGLAIAQLAIGILGVLLITSEYSTRAISSTLSAVPRRSRMLVAKGAVMLAMTFVVVEIIAFVAFFIGQALMSGHAPTASIGNSGVLRALIGDGLYGAGLGLFGLALGAILRSAAGSIAVLVAVIFVLPGVAAALPTSIEHAVQEYWPTQAGSQITSVVRTAHTLTPWAGLGVFAIFVAVMSAIALRLLNSRDA